MVERTESSFILIFFSAISNLPIHSSFLFPNISVGKNISKTLQNSIKSTNYNENHDVFYKTILRT